LDYKKIESEYGNDISRHFSQLEKQKEKAERTSIAETYGQDIAQHLNQVNAVHEASQRQARRQEANNHYISRFTEALREKHSEPINKVMGRLLAEIKAQHQHSDMQGFENYTDIAYEIMIRYVNDYFEFYRRNQS